MQRGKDRRAPFLQKPGAPDLTKILELVQIDLFEEERIFCYATIVFQFMSDCASQWVVKSSWDGDGRTQVKVTVGDRVFTLDTEWNHVAESPTSSKIHEEQVGQSLTFNSKPQTWSESFVLLPTFSSPTSYKIHEEQIGEVDFHFKTTSMKWKFCSPPDF